jgi:acyl carrier protein
MTEQDLKTAVRQALARVAPETAAADLDPHVPLRDQCDLDSMDFLNFVIALHASLKVDVPEADYPNLVSLNAAVEYLAKRLGVS